MGDKEGIIKKLIINVHFSFLCLLWLSSADVSFPMYSQIVWSVNISFLFIFKIIKQFDLYRRNKDINQIKWRFFCIIYCDSMVNVVTSHSRHYVTKIKSDLSNNKHIIHVINSIFLLNNTLYTMNWSKFRLQLDKKDYHYHCEDILHWGKHILFLRRLHSGLNRIYS